MRSDDASTLLAALAGGSPWLRAGAALALAARGEQRAVTALEAAAHAASPESDELWLLILALHRLGADTRPRAAQATGFDSVAGLVSHLPPAWDDFANYWNSRREVPYVAHQVLAQIRQRELTGGYAPAAGEPQEARAADAFAQAAAQLSWAQHLLRTLYRGHPQDLGSAEAARLDPIIDALRSEPPDAPRGVYNLVELCLTHPRRPLRDYAAPALATLHASPASSLLLRTLLGIPAFVPSRDALAGMREEGGAQDAGGMDDEAAVGREMAVCLACDALEEFTDADTCWRVCQLAVHEHEFVRARAQGVLLGMSCEASLPALVWALLTPAGRDEHARSSELLARILDGSREYDRPLWRIGDQRYAVDLRWVGDLVDATLALPDWSDERSPGGPLAWLRSRRLTQEVLAHAIGSVALRQHPVTIQHSTSDTWHAFVGAVSGFRERVRSIRRERATTSVPYATAARFPATCALDGEHALEVEIAARTGESAGPSDFAVAFPNDAPVDLTVLVRSPGFAVTPAWARLTVAPDTTRAVVPFTLRALSKGRHLIEIDLLRGADRLAHLEVATTVRPRNLVWWSGSAEASGTLDGDRLAARARLRAVIVADWQPDAGLSLDLLDTASADAAPEPMGTMLRGLTPGEIGDWSNGFLNQMKDYVEYDYTSAADVDVAVAKIAALGRELFEQVVPAPLAARIAQWPRGAAIGIDTNETWIPWELLCHDPAAGVLGDIFDIVRIPRSPVEVNAAGPAATRSDGEARPGLVEQAASVIGDRIRTGDGTPLRVFPSGLAVTPALEPRLPDLQALAASVDVLHFTCHGREDAASRTYYLSLGLDLLQRLHPADVATFVLKPGALVFANSCSSGKPAPSLRHFVGFGWRFYERGARPFIGTLATVPAPQAFDFATAFYDALLVDGLPPSRALRQAKAAVRARHLNPFWLFYCIYGGADDVRRPGAEAVVGGGGR